MRGWPVPSSPFSHLAAALMGHRAESALFVLSGFFMACNHASAPLRVCSRRHTLDPRSLRDYGRFCVVASNDNGPMRTHVNEFAKSLFMAHSPQKCLAVISIVRRWIAVAVSTLPGNRTIGDYVRARPSLRSLEWVIRCRVQPHRSRATRYRSLIRVREVLPTNRPSWILAKVAPGSRTRSRHHTVSCSSIAGMSRRL